MLIHDGFNLFIRHVVTQLCESVLKGGTYDFVLAFCIKLLEKRRETLSCRVLLDWERGSDKLMIVDDASSLDVNLLNDFLELSLRHVCMAGPDRIT